MRLRQLWQWPALFVAFVSLAGSMALNSAVAAAPLSFATEHGIATHEQAPDQEVVRALALACETALREISAPPSSLRASRDAADGIDRIVANVMSAHAGVASSTIDLLARFVAAADGLRSPDKSARSGARANLMLLAATLGSRSA